VALNPVIKFTTLFGLLAVEIAVTIHQQSIKTLIGGLFLIVALVFIYRSFYGMRIPEEDLSGEDNAKSSPASSAPAEKKTFDTAVTKTGTSGSASASTVVNRGH
jgi:K(+)-stimulated pyrophosphate-energized sodium pump